MRLVINPLARRGGYSHDESLVTSHRRAVDALSEISQWPGYKVTPLRPLAAMAKDLGLAELLLKDESDRLGLGSFKSLGGAYAATLRLRKLDGQGPFTLCCATDGNHGQSVAHAAKLQGCAAFVYMHENALEYKADAIRALGATVVRVAGTYDDSVRAASQAAHDNGWLLISDTGGVDDETVQRVMQGYGVMALELISQFEGRPLPTHVMLQGGVGGLAAGLAGVLSEVYGERRPRFIVVEPETAACLFESAVRFKPSTIDGDLLTEMHMLAAGEASAAAWTILQARMDAFVAIADRTAIEAAARLNQAEPGRPALDIGITGAAGLAGLVEIMRRPELAEVVGLNTDARVLAIGTEAGPPRTHAAGASPV